MNEGMRKFENEELCDASDFLSRISETIFTPEEASSKTEKKLSERTRFYKQLLFDVGEVVSAYEVLVDFPLLARSKPPKSPRLTPTKVIIFWREAYLNESYIFNCRLLTLIKRVGRAYRHVEDGSKIEELCNVLEGLVQESMEPLVKMRGVHVHEVRYVTSDPELDRIQLLETMASGTGGKEFKRLYSQAIREARKQSTANFRAFNTHAKDRLKTTFDAFLYFLVDTDDQLQYPTNLKQ